MEEEERDWTSLVGCVKKEGISNEQKFLVMTFRPNDRIFTKGMSEQETMEKLILGIYNVAHSQAIPKNVMRNAICALEELERTM